jgi:predicted PurR-regulated permease PerM
VALLIVALRLIAPFLNLVLLALFFAIIFTPIFHWLQRKGLPSGWAMLLMIVGIIVAGLSLIGFVFVSFKQLANSLSAYQGLLDNQMASLQAGFAQFGLDLSSVRLVDLIDIESVIGWITSLLTSLGGLAATSIFIIITIIFSMSEAAGFRSRLQQALGRDNLLVTRTGQFTQSMVRYVAMRAIVNLITGVAVALLLLILDIDFALLWGVLTFFLSFVPYIGIFLATAPSVLLALAQYGPGMAIFVIVAVTIINVMAENLVAPKIIGRGLSISPLIVFLSFFFWSWVLGPAGMLLAMPLTVMVLFIVQSFEETRWLAALMGTTSTASAVAPNDTAGAADETREKVE